MNPVSQQEQPVTKKRGRKRKFDEEFRRKALEQMKTCDNVTELARRLGIRRKWLYKWRDEATGRQSAQAQKGQPITAARGTDQREKERVAELERLVGRLTLENDFFRGALLRVEEKRRKRESTSGTPSTSKSGK